MLLSAAGGPSAATISGRRRTAARGTTTNSSRTRRRAASSSADADARSPPPLDAPTTPTPSRRQSLALGGLLTTLLPSSPAHAARTVVVGPGGAYASAAPDTTTTATARRRQVLAADPGEEVMAYEHGVSLAIVALRGSVPAQWVLDFRRTLGRYSGFSLDQRPQLDGIFGELEPAVAGRAAAADDTSAAAKQKHKKKDNSAASADVVTLGDAWLGAAVKRGLVQPIPGAAGARWWRRLPLRWQRLARRDPQTGAPSASGEVYACPYRWGAMLIAYKRPVLEKKRRPGREHLERVLQALPVPVLPGRERLRDGASNNNNNNNNNNDPVADPRPIRDWSDLLQPALRGRVAFSDSPRELVGIALKTLGLPFNATATEARRCGVTPDALRERVSALRAQARLFSGRDHVRALGTGDVHAIVGTSADLVPLAERAPTVALVAPESGTALWADLWAVPSRAKGGHLQQGPAPTLAPWLEFCTSPARVGTLGSLRTGATPLLLPPTGGQEEQGVGGWFARAARFLGRKQRVGRGPREGEGDDEPWRLSNRRGYLPPRDILARSEFLAPLDPETADLYAYALRRTS
jgi:hypothetical protein